MQRYSTPSCGGGFASNSPGGVLARDNVRAEPSFSSSNYTLNSRRLSQLAPFKLKCEKDSLSRRLGPPDFYPQTPNCPEETLTREYLLSGYKDTVEGIEEAKEIVCCSQLGFLSKPVILKCKEAIRKRLRAINESRAKKRKVGQVYGVPLSGQLFAKPGLFPEQRHCDEDSKKKWIEGLSQQHKRLCSLADHVPHGYRKKYLLEVIIRHNVPLLRATWFIKVSYLNQVRPAATGISSAASDKTQSVRAEAWTKDLIEYLHNLLDEILAKDGFSSIGQNRNKTSQTFLPGPPHQRADGLLVNTDGIDPSPQIKWRYVVRLLQWHYAEGLLLPSLVIDWVLAQLQGRESVQTWELLFPVLVDLIENIAQSHTYMRLFVDVATRFLHNLCPAGVDLLVNAQKTHITFPLVEMVRQLLLTVPDTFVSFDCFPVPVIVAPDMLESKKLLPWISESAEKVGHGFQDAYNRYLSFGHVTSSLRKRVSNLSKIVSPNLQGRGMPKVVQMLDKALLQGDAGITYICLFEEFSDAAIDEHWITEVSPALRSSLKWIGKVTLSLISAVFFLCEWATCDFRDFRTSRPLDAKLSGTKDFCQVYFAVLLLKLKKEDMQNSSFQSEKGSLLTPGHIAEQNSSLHCGLSSGATVENISVLTESTKISNKRASSDIYQRPGPLHDIIVCWLDQHEAGKGEGFKRLEILILELIRHNIFSPQAYVRQLLVSGIMDRTGMPSNLEKQRRHHRILKQLPGSCLADVLGESKFCETDVLSNSVHTYSNERHLVLNEFSSGKSITLGSRSNGPFIFGCGKLEDPLHVARNGVSPSAVDNQKSFSFNSHSWANKKAMSQVDLLSAAISTLLRLPHPRHSTIETCPEEYRVKLKRPFRSLNGKLDSEEGSTEGGECTWVKKQKIINESSSQLQGLSSNQSDDDGTWWVRKGLGSMDSLKTEQPKSAKHSPKGWQKSIRKTSSLAQLAAARIESNQGASTSHVCDNKVGCPHHKTVVEAETPKSINRASISDLSDIGKAFKKLRWLEKRSITVWLLSFVKQLVDGNENSTSKAAQSGSPFSSKVNEEKNIGRWKFGENDLLSVLYLLDVSADLYSSVKFLLWLLSKIGGPADVQLGRNTMLSARTKENNPLHVGEAFLFSALQRYENVIVATDLLPEALTAAFHRAIVNTGSNMRASGSLALIYARKLLKKYGSISNVAKWEKGFRATCDPRFLPELDSRSQDADIGYALGPVAGIEDIDEYFRQKMSGRISRAASIMKDIVQRHTEEVVLHFLGKERKHFGVGGNVKISTFEKCDDGNQIAYQIVLGLIDCIRQYGGSSQEGDPLLVAAAVSAIVGNVGPAIAKLPESISSSNHQNSSNVSSLNCIRAIISIHIACLSFLKEAVGERLSRVLEISLAAEAFSNVIGAFSPGKVPRGQFQLSPENHDMSSNISNDYLNSSSKLLLGKTSKIAAAVSSLLVGAIIHGFSTLDRMITVLKLKEGLDFFHFMKSTRSGSNGISRSASNFRPDHCIEVYVHWFRLLIGNSRTIFDGLVADILGESYTSALCRMQRMLPLKMVFSPAYSMFTIVVLRPYIHNNVPAREDIQIHNQLSVAIGDAIMHQPFRDICLRDSQGFYDLLSAEISESEFGSILDLHNPDKTLKSLPFRSRLFLNAIVDCAMPSFPKTQDDGSWVSAHGDPRHTENETKPLDQLVHVLDTIQPAKFHWQWLELRLLLNEQILIEKVDTHSVSPVEALRSLSSTIDNSTLSEHENMFTEIVLTRLLNRPDAAALYSEVFHLLGRSLEEKLLLSTKWFLAGNDVLLGRKSIRQRLVNVAQLNGLSTKAQNWKPWGWPNAASDLPAVKPDKRKLELSSLEEGEVVEEGVDIKKLGKSSTQLFDGVESSFGQHYVTDKALAELVLPSIDRSSSEARTAFASDLIKQMNTIYQHINSLSCGAGKQSTVITSGCEGSANKSSTRKTTRGGSPGLGRRTIGTKDSGPPSAPLLRASIWLRLQFLLRLLPVICTDREPSSQKLRQMLASVLLHLLGTQVVYEDADVSFISMQKPSTMKESEITSGSSIGTLLNLPGDNLFDMISSVLHVLLSGCKPSWLRATSSKSTVKSSRDFYAADREIAESLQADLDRMQLPSSIRRRLQAAMPMIPPHLPFLVSCNPPVESSTALSLLQPFPWNNGSHQLNVNPSQRVASASRPAANTNSRYRPLPFQDSAMEIDPWTLLEDGTDLPFASSSSNNLGSGSSDHSNLKASCWLKGAVRVRRTDLTYIGAIDDDS